MESNDFDFVSVFNIVPIPGLVVNYADELKEVHMVNKAFLENADIDLPSIKSQKIHDLLQHLYLIDEKGEHFELNKALKYVLDKNEEIDLFILRTNVENGICRLEDNFNQLRISKITISEDANQSFLSLFFHKGGLLAVQQMTHDDLAEKLVCTIDTNGFITHVDSSSIKTWGYEPDELLNTTLVHLLPNESRIYSWELFLEMLKKLRTISTDRTMYLKDKSIIPVNFTAVWDEENQKINGIVRDLRTKLESQFDTVRNEHRMKSLLKEGVDLIAIVDSEGKFNYLSPNFEKYLKSEIHSYLGESAFEFIHPEDRYEIEIEFRQAMTINRIQSSPYRIEDKNGRIRWFETVCTNLLNDPSINGIVLNTRDITETYYSNRLEKLEREILEKNALPGSNLSDVASEYILGIEKLHEGMTCSLLSIKNECLFNLASPSLPKDYTNMIEGLKIGDNRGSCGTAAFTKKQVIVSDIQHDIRWADFKDLIQPFGYKACWSMPIIDSSNEVIATFAIYYKDTKEPSIQEHLIINRSAQILRVIIENYCRLEDIKMANDRFHYVTKATSDVIWDWDILTDKMFWGNGMFENFGHPIEPLSVNSFEWAKYVHPDDHEQVIKSMRKQLESENENWESEYRYLKASGEYAIILDRGFIIRDQHKKPIRMVGAMTDITFERKLQGLLENASRLAKMGTWEVDLIHSKVFFSKITREIHELDDSFVPTVENAVQFYKEGNNRNSIVQAMSDAIMNGESWDIELEIISAKGNTKWIRAMGEPEFVNGNCVKLYGNFQDINERKLVELKLQELNEVLEHRAKQLAVSNEELQQFAYVASHDLQEPLRMVSSFLTLLEKKYAEQLDEKANQYIHYAVDGAQRMRHVILDLLEYSKVGNIDEARKKINLKLLIEEILILHRKQIQEIEASFIIDPLPTISSFETPIRQVFQNLISNGLKYYSKVDKPIITISAKEDEDYYVFSVTDNGIGIDEMFKEKIFQIFQRLHTKDQYHGTGVGLAICKKVMDSMKGEIWLDTNYKKGTKFCFKIPRK